MSAYPLIELIERKQLEVKKIKVAMALKGKNAHYHWHTRATQAFFRNSKSS
jgi:serine/threonine-protein kinase HipA